MGKELTIIALAAVVIFGFWYFNKAGCTGEGGLTGPEGSLCWNGPSIEEMFSGGSSDGDDEVAADEPEIGSTDSRIAGLCESQGGTWTGPGGCCENCPQCSQVPKCKSSSLATAYASYVNNQITVA